MRMSSREATKLLTDNPNIKLNGLSRKKSLIQSLEEGAQSGKKISETIKSRSPDDMGGSKESDTGNIAENRLFMMVWDVFSDFDIRREVSVVCGRNFRSDVALILPEEVGYSGLKGVLFELDGYRHHGLSKSGFKRDREKDRATTLAGFITVRFYASEILNRKNEELNYQYLEQFKENYLEKLK